MRSAVTLLLVLLLPLQPALAWSEGGHHLIAVLAFRQLPREQQMESLRILRAHPRFAEDFKLPNNVRNEEEWLIGRAAYWPDVARRQNEFNRPNWHFQLGSCSNIGNVSPPAFPGPLPAGATLETKELHIAQALEMCAKILSDKSKPDAERAIALCWIGHLVGDAHQPCHAGSLYAEGLFPEGDRGANSIPTKQSKNMHALWDGLLGPKWDEGNMNRRAAEIEGDKALRDAAEIATNRLGVTSETWLGESREYAKQFVYAPVVMEPISVAMRSGGSLSEIDLPEHYLKDAGAIAKRRAAEAAARLAEVLESSLR